MCIKWVRNLQPFMEDRICLDGDTSTLYCGSCRKEKPETKMAHNVPSNKIEITCGIHEDLYFLPYKNHHESFSASKIFVLRRTMTQTRLIHRSNLCSSGIGPDVLLVSQDFFWHCASPWHFFSPWEQKTSFLRPSSCKKLATRSSLCSSWAKVEGVGQVRFSKDGLGSPSRLGQSFFARATSSCFVYGMLDFLQIFFCIGLSNPAKKSITFIPAGSLASSPICVLRVWNCWKNLSSDSLDGFWLAPNQALKYWSNRHDLLKVDPENLWRPPSRQNRSFPLGSGSRNQLPQ